MGHTINDNNRYTVLDANNLDKTVTMQPDKVLRIQFNHQTVV